MSQSACMIVVYSFSLVQHSTATINQLRDFLLLFCLCESKGRLFVFCNVGATNESFWRCYFGFWEIHSLLPFCPINIESIMKLIVTAATVEHCTDLPQLFLFSGQRPEARQWAVSQAAHWSSSSSFVWRHGTVMCNAIFFLLKLIWEDVTHTFNLQSVSCNHFKLVLL